MSSRLFRKRRWPVALAVAGAVVLVAMMVLLFRGDDPPDQRGMPLPSREYGVFPSASPTPLVALLSDAAAIARYADATVTARSARVDEPVGAVATWVGDGPGRRVLVVLVGDGLPSFDVRPGDRLSFAATVRPAGRGVAQAFGLDGEDAAELERQRGYLEVTTPYAVE